jgi:para-nitrobenzyl esterase
MKKICYSLLVLAASLVVTSCGQKGLKDNQVQTPDGIIEGTVEPDGLRVFKGIPFAQPPVGVLRWKAPQPVTPWDTVLMAKAFGPQPMQNRIYDDMVFRSQPKSEDCLYLNVWTPAKSDQEKLPVLVYFYGGGFMAGDGSEPRYDGASMARKGIVTLTVNYRLGVFGFLSLPALTEESPHHASGNYGLMDQNAALRWVQRNIAAFGGDPARVTIAGQSAGSMSVSAQMASPLSKGLFAAAIGESGAVLGNLTPPTLKENEKKGEVFMQMAGAKDLAALRALPAEKLLALTAQPGAPYFAATIDGYFFPDSPDQIFARGAQAKVPLLAGWTSAETGFQGILGKAAPTPDNYRKAIQRLYGKDADSILRLYPGRDTLAVMQSATALASDRFIVYSTWKWMESHLKTSGQPVYRYLYAHLLPAPKGADAPAGKRMGARHSAEIPYALGNLDLVQAYSWTADDHKVSSTMQDFFARFIQHGDPNGPGLPHWPQLQAGAPQVMYIDTESKAVEPQHDQRYQFLERLYGR